MCPEMITFKVSPSGGQGILKLVPNFRTRIKHKGVGTVQAWIAITNKQGVPFGTPCNMNYIIILLVGYLIPHTGSHQVQHNMQQCETY